MLSNVWSRSGNKLKVEMLEDHFRNDFDFIDFSMLFVQMTFRAQLDAGP